MFEKEAKKWVKDNTHTEYSASFGEIKVEPSAEKGFQKGAEFGYSKGKNEAKEIILKLYNAGRDVLMCKAEEKAFYNLSKAINDKSIEQFLEETR